MDILIKNMKMPKSCSECMFCSLGGLGKIRVVECDILSEIDDVHDISENYDKWYYNQVHHLCPLVELPPHGSLKDYDSIGEKMANKMEKRKRTWHPFYYEGFKEALKMLDSAPTIVEASK